MIQFLMKVIGITNKSNNKYQDKTIRLSVVPPTKINNNITEFNPDTIIDGPWQVIIIFPLVRGQGHINTYNIIKLFVYRR